MATATTTTIAIRADRPQPTCYVCGGKHLKPKCFFHNLEEAPEAWKAKYITEAKRTAQLAVQRKKNNWVAPAPRPGRAYSTQDVVYNVSSSQIKDPSW